MSGYRRVNYYELCRLCTSNKGTKVHLFKEEGKRRQIPTKIQICLRLQVNEQDTLPKLICNLCLDKLEGYFNFRSNCVNAEAMLKSYAKNLSFNSNYIMEGKVYIKENKLDSFEEDTVKNDIISSKSSSQGSTFHFKENDIKVSSQTNEIVSLPINPDHLGHLVQATTIHIVPEKELAKLNNLKSTIQVQQTVKRITGEHSYSYSVQEQVAGDESTNQNLEHNLNLNGITESSIQTDMQEKTELVSHASEAVGDVSQDSRNSISQISEFLQLKTIPTEEAIDCSCQNCGLVFTSYIEKSTHCESCSSIEGIEDSLKINEPVVMVDVEEDKPVVNCGPFNCDDCGKIFKRKEHLVQHKRLHTGERPFRCSQCPSTFSRKEHLVRHILCHTGEKHYSCGICGKLFGRKDNVGKHMRTHQIKTVFLTDGSNAVTASCEQEDDSNIGHKCDFCGKHLPTRVLLKKHISLSHMDTDKCNFVVLNNEQPVSILEKALKQIPG